MILSHDAILARLELGQIFKGDSWGEKCLKQASYALRVAPDGLMVDGNRFEPGKKSISGDIIIKPGKIAILSTIEKLNMPSDLLGKIGIRFDFACQGLTGLMGIQVDPYYGWGHDDERLYVRVANLGNRDISIPLNAEVFTFELHVVYGFVPKPTKPRVPMWLRIQDTLWEQSDASWSYVTQVQFDSNEALSDMRGQLSEHRKSVDDKLSTESDSLKDALSSETESLRQHLQPLVMFGIFLVAVTILGVSLTVILSVRDIPSVDVPGFVTDWGWILLLISLSVATVATALMGAAMVVWTVKRYWNGERSLKANETD